MLLTGLPRFTLITMKKKYLKIALINQTIHLLILNSNTLIMKTIILGSGGAIPTPRPLCQCNLCVKARKEGSPYKRNSSSFYIEDIKTLIDCPEDISDSLNSNDIKEVKNLFITHWHPDHTFGLRLLLESGFDFNEDKVVNQINIYIPKSVWKTLKEKYPTIHYMIDVKKFGKIIFIEEGDILEFNNITIKPIGYKGVASDNYAYLIEENNKKLLYSSCDTIDFKQYSKFKDVDIWVTECGMFTDYESEISFDCLIDRIKKIKPKKTILIHIEEEELKVATWSILEKLENKNKDLNLKFSIDGMKIAL